MQEWRKREIPEKTRRPAASSGTITHVRKSGKRPRRELNPIRVVGGGGLVVLPPHYRGIFKVSGASCPVSGSWSAPTVFVRCAGQTLGREAPDVQSIGCKRDGGEGIVCVMMDERSQGSSPVMDADRSSVRADFSGGYVSTAEDYSARSPLTDILRMLDCLWLGGRFAPPRRLAGENCGYESRTTKKKISSTRQNALITWRARCCAEEATNRRDGEASISPSSPVCGNKSTHEHVHARNALARAWKCTCGSALTVQAGFGTLNSDKGDTATLIKFAVAAEREALNRRCVQVFSSHCVYLLDFQRRPCNFIDGKSLGRFSAGS
ncbi:hypothetical protein PR048_014859 [Dryococelus australis]|uniref:Uncharacterized protein n=1 Tax=Dryococelus australis TaxID=614101 RepID=A0ABQ9HFA9_9NEOP|nr:hypothetical protein PR048_014859 [Dryococelus australis]